jgi:hypothetical protein
LLIPLLWFYKCLPHKECPPRLAMILLHPALSFLLLCYTTAEYKIWIRSLICNPFYNSEPLFYFCIRVGKWIISPLWFEVLTVWRLIPVINIQAAYCQACQDMWFNYFGYYRQSSDNEYLTLISRRLRQKQMADENCVVNIWTHMKSLLMLTLHLCISRRLSDCSRAIVISFQVTLME